MYGGVGEKEEDPKNTSLEGRIAKYYIITKALNPASFTESCLENDGEKYKIKDKGATVVLELSRKKGVSTSVYGVIYNTKYTGSVYEYEIVSKLMKPNMDENEYIIRDGVYDNRDNEKEIYLMKVATKLILNKSSKHFLLIYFYSKCDNKLQPIDTQPIDDFPVSYVIYTEPATGDIRSLLKKSSKTLDNITLLNILIQSIISLGTFHNRVGYIHNDCHTGNFLYQDNFEYQENYYYHYILDSLNYRLKSCNYNIMIYDFGNSIKIENMSSHNAIINAILNRIITNDIIINYKEQIITYDEDEGSFKAGDFVLGIKLLSGLITQNIYKYINELIKIDYIVLIDEFKNELPKDNKMSNILDELLTDIQNIQIEGNAIDSKTIFKKVMEIVITLCNTRFNSDNILLQDTLPSSIINAQPYKISR